MEHDSLLNRAITCFNAAVILKNNLTVDELFLNQIAYLIQQAYEMTIKFLLENDGVEYPKTHDIDQLIRLAGERGVELYISEYLDEHSEMISQWESKSRYVLGYLVEYRKIERALEDLRLYIHRVKQEFESSID